MDCIHLITLATKWKTRNASLLQGNESARTTTVELIKRIIHDHKNVFIQKSQVISFGEEFNNHKARYKVVIQTPKVRKLKTVYNIARVIRKNLLDQQHIIDLCVFECVSLGEDQTIVPWAPAFN